MGKHLLKKWTIPLLLITVMFSSCVNKDYDMDNINDEMVLKDVVLTFPLGTIRYSALELAKRANFGHDIVVEGDTLFLRYYTELGTSTNYEQLGINVFTDVEEGSLLYFSNPIFNCKVENKGNALMTFNINSMVGSKPGFADTPLTFNGNPSCAISVPEKQTVIKRFDRIYGDTHTVFGKMLGVGPDLMKFDFSHDGTNVFADMTALLPLTFDKDSKIIFRDTLLLDLASHKEDYEKYEDKVDYVEITLDYINRMPTGGITDFIFLDENDQVITGIERASKLEKPALKGVQLQGFDSNITQADKVGTMYIIFDHSDWVKVKTIKSMIVKGTMTNSENIHVLPNDFLQIKIEATLKGSVKLDF